MSTVVFSPKAYQDLIDIHDYIAEQSVQAASHFIDFIEEKCNLLAGSSSMGRRRPEFGAAVRSFPVGEYVIFYVPVSDGVEIVHVLHSKRDIHRIYW